jgi:hypothetical protein
MFAALHSSNSVVLGSKWRGPAVCAALALVGLQPTAWAQSVCSNQLFPYTGPSDGTELANLLFTSEAPAIAALDDATRQSLINLTMFEDGVLLGLSAKDDNIDTLVASGIDDLLFEITGVPVVTYWAESRPDYELVTTEQLLAFAPNFEPVYSWCLNCYPIRDPDDCCHVANAICRDAVAALDGALFKVTDQTACAAYCPPCPGDSNLDRQVDFADLAILLSAFGEVGGRFEGDLDGDGFVGLPDLTILLSVFGTGC